MYRWYRMVFTDLYPTTDIWKYRSMAELLVPWKNETNRFRIVSSPDVTDFYIGSSGMESMSMMKSFFKRLYDIRLEPVPDDPGEPYPLRKFIFVPRRSMRPLYSTSLIQNLSNIHAISGRELVTDLAMYRSGREKVLVSMRIGTFSELHTLRGENAYIDRVLRKFSRESRIRVREVRRTGSFHRAAGFEPSRLINIVRVPEDEDEP